MTPTIPVAAEEFLSYLSVERGRAPATLAAYRRDLRAYCDFLAERGVAVEDATTRDVEAYLAGLERRGLAPSSCARATATIRGLHAFLAEEGLTHADPTALLASRRAPNQLPIVLTEAQVADLLAAPSSDSPRDLRDRAVLEVLYGTGIRVSELVALDVGDVDFDEELVRVTGKGDKQRLVPLGRGAASSLRAWLSPEARGALLAAARRGQPTALFCNLRGRRLTRQGVDLCVRRHARRAHLPDATSAHTLRHTCATHMLAHGADVRSIQELLGHASVATTQRYTKVAIGHLEEAYAHAHPRAAGSAPR